MFKKNSNKKYSPELKTKQILSKEKKSSTQPNKTSNIFKKNHVLNDKLPKNQSPKSNLAHKLSFAIISALTIGLITGFTMLHLLTNKEDSLLESTEENMKTEHVTTPEASNAEDHLVTYEFQSLRAFTLQIGVFSDNANAEQFIELLDDKSYMPVIWPYDGLHYVFIGLAPTKEQAEDLKEIVVPIETDPFIKEWQTESFTKQVSPEEKQWLESFTAHWESVLKDKENINDINQNWQR